MCTQNQSLKLICLTCFFIMTVDTIVLYQTVLQWFEIEARSDPYVFHQCYQPQIIMRIIFTCYAINAAALCFILTLALSFLQDHHVEQVAMKLFTYTYLVFGPVLLICCIYGLIYFKGLLFECQPNRVSKTINFMDIFILLGCTAFSSIITLFFAMHKSVEMANEHLRDEHSVFYRIFLRYLNYKRATLARSQYPNLMNNSQNAQNYQAIQQSEQEQVRENEEEQKNQEDNGQQESTAIQSV